MTTENGRSLPQPEGEKLPEGQALNLPHNNNINRSAIGSEPEPKENGHRLSGTTANPSRGHTAADSPAAGLTEGRKVAHSNGEMTRANGEMTRANGEITEANAAGSESPSGNGRGGRPDVTQDTDQLDDEGNPGCCGRKSKEKAPTVGTLELFKYATPVERFMMVVGILAAMATGCAQPINMLIFGETVNKFIGVMDEVRVSKSNSSSNATLPDYGDRIEEQMQPLIIFFVVVGVVSTATGFVGTWLWTWCGERQIARIRKLFFKAVLRQDIGWFDMHKGGELNSRFADDMHKIHEGMGDKVPNFIQWITTFIGSYVIALVKGWKLALAIFAFTPFFVLVGAIVAKLSRTMAVKELKAYAKAGAVADQALRAIRTVQAFQGQEKELTKYEKNLGDAEKVAIHKGMALGLGFGLFWIVIYVTFAVAFYIGIVFMQQDGLNPGNIMTVFFSVLIGSMSLGNAFPNLESVTNARAGAVTIYELLELRPVIDVSSDQGVKLDKLDGVIQFKDISFRYPARPEIEILKGFNLTVKPGETVALVGPSGCGKSTTVQLLQRFYDPLAGQVTIDGHDVKTINVKWLRDLMGVVSQEPVLFAATIADNIRYGNPRATQADIETAAKEANVHAFIASLPLGYDTLIGERGSQLSGGQKQRIAIARALVKNPRILLLDEATSALDQESEALVQNALEKAGKGRTTLVIAHRLSTIRGADKIVAISQGRKMEEGTHDQLMQMDGLYAQLVKLQTKAETDEGVDITDLEIVEETGMETEDNRGGGTAGDPKIFFRSVSRTSQRSGYKPVNPGGPSAVVRMDSEMAEDKTEDVKAEPASALRVLKMNSPEWGYITTGTIMAVLNGLAQPCFAFVLAEFLRVFALTDKPDEQLRQAAILSGIISGVSVFVAFCRFGQGYSFAKSGTALTARIRMLTFRSMLRQDMSFFDQQENQVGVLTTRLASDAAIVQGATGSKIGSAVEAFSTLATALIIAFIYGWKLTLVVLAFLPVMIVSGKVQGTVISGSAKSEKSQLQEAGKIFSEAVDNIRTVTSINRSDVFIDKLEQLMKATSRIGCKKSPVYGMTYGLSVGIVYFAFAGAFAFGTKMVAIGEMEFFDIFRVFSAIIFGGASVGRSASFGMDYTKARVAAANLFAIMDTVPKIELDQKGSSIDNYRGKVSLDSVVFRYPTRPTIPVLQGLTVSMEAGQTLALVGGSGCGKSTVMQLLQRFYDPESGRVMVEGKDLRSMDLRWFRQQVGIVSQEPTLFDDSIANNIAYGDNSRQVPMEEIIAAARAANIHNFIQSIPQGYETNVGDKGTQLSGGQKQRIAIARALIRNPKILLLDEATSALDTESERVVQEALDRARQGRTCIVIAHRLTTIQNADRIAVVHEGKLHEIGTHSQLVAMQGKYYSLLTAQNH